MFDRPIDEKDKLFKKAGKWDEPDKNRPVDQLAMFEYTLNLSAIMNNRIMKNSKKITLEYY